MTRVNTLPAITWRYLESNHVDLKLDHLKTEEIKLKNKVSEDFHTHFKDIKFGLCPEIIEINEKYRNLEEYYEFSEKENIEKKFELNGDNSYLSDLHAINVKEGADATLLLDYKSDDGQKSLRNTVIKIKAEKNSKLKLVLVQRLSKKSESYLSIVSDIASEASVELVHVEIGSNKAYSNYMVNLKEEKADSTIRTAYFVDGRRYLDLGYVMTHIGEKTTSDMVVNGVLKDHAKKRFSGTLDFKKGCTLSEGNEEEFVTLLDPTVVNRAVPILLAREHDIVGNHAASAGRIDKDMLFYITSRGFDPLAAKRIIIESKIKPVLDLIDNEEIAEEILEEIREGIKE